MVTDILLCVTKPGDIPMFCRTCRRALDLAEVGGVRRWLHGGDMALGHRRIDHVPLPVKVTELADPIIRCDFCSEDGAVFNYTCAPQQTRVGLSETTVGVREYHERNVAAKGKRVATGEIGGIESGENWSACLACAELLDARDQDGLVNRVADHAPQRLRRRIAAFRADINVRYTELFATLRPGRRRILPEPGVLFGPVEYPDHAP